MHELVAARLGRSELALNFLRQTSAIDLADTHASLDGGVHIASLGGVWMITVLGFAGLTVLPDALAIDPQLPAGPHWNLPVNGAVACSTFVSIKPRTA